MIDKNAIFLTIIIPVYNCKKYLKFGFQNLKSLYNFDFKFEIIYVNDGSTDESLSIIHLIAEENENIIIINQNNLGASQARNAGLKIAKGKYISFLDSDDYIDIKPYLNLLTKIDQFNLDVLGFRLDYRDENNNLIGIRAKQNVLFNTIISGKQALIQGYNPSSFCVFIFKKELFLNHNLSITPNVSHEDVELTTRIMLVAQKVMFVDEVIYHYLQRIGSFSKPIEKHKIEKNLIDEIIIANLVRKNILYYNLKDKDLIKAINKNYNAIIWNLLYRLVTKKETDYNFKLKCLNKLIELNLYPIKGSLKTNFQKITTIFFNFPLLYKLLLKFKD
ncbi:WcaA Glycosyltransferases involved in cell wall biogenesis [Flavobacteriaceae bacterium]